MKFAVKFRVYPTEEQEKTFRSWMHASRIFWNLCLEKRDKLYEKKKNGELEDGVNINFSISMKSFIPNNKEYGRDSIVAYASSNRDLSWFYDIPKGIFEEMLSNLNEAFDKFLKDKSKQVGKPKFKKFNAVNSIANRYHACKTADDRIDWNKKTIQILGRKNNAVILKAKFNKKFDGIIKEFTVSVNKLNQWFLSLVVEDGKEIENVNDTIGEMDIVGIDLGLHTFAVIADATQDNEDCEKIQLKYSKENVEKAKKRIKHYQRKIPRCEVTLTREGCEPKKITFAEYVSKLTENKNAFNGRRVNFSKNYDDLVRKIFKWSSRKANILKYAYHGFTHDMVHSDFLAFALEDLGIKDMMNKAKQKEEREKKKEEGKFALGRKAYKSKNRHFAEHSLYEIRRQIEYKAAKLGKRVFFVDRKFASSQTCTVCGFKNKEVKDERVREWVCPQCGAVHDRDGNAAKNIAKEGLRLYLEEKENAS